MEWLCIIAMAAPYLAAIAGVIFYLIVEPDALWIYIPYIGVILFLYSMVLWIIWS